MAGKGLLGVYFSGTGNTRHCVETFVKSYDDWSTAISIEAPGVPDQIATHDLLVLGYPVYFSNVPKMMRDFLRDHSAAFAGKRVFLVATMGLFSGDGAGCAARVLRECGAEIIGGLHLKMPDCIGDERALKKTVEANRELVAAADRKIAAAVEKLKKGSPEKEGLHFMHHLAGLLGQRLWFFWQTASYKKKPKIDREKCMGCGQCARLCPMDNLVIEGDKAVSLGRCTLCYRCFSHCPAQAMTILGKRVYEQCLLENDTGQTGQPPKDC